MHKHKAGKQILSSEGLPISEVRERQKAFFQSGKTLPIDFRKQQLKQLMKVLKGNEQKLMTALKEDLGKPDFEAYFAEVGLIYSEIKLQLRKLNSWNRRRRVGSPMTVMPAKSYIYPRPKGQTLVIGPWNYPIQLVMLPALGAICAGNTLVIKPSELTPKSTEILTKILAEVFPVDHVAVFQGGAEVSQALLEEPWDHIFFTGSCQVGQIVATAAAKTLSPVTLELGGKSPCIVTAQANLKVAAKRIMSAKFFNVGQTCVAPDYILVESSVRDEFLKYLKQHLQESYGNKPQKSPFLGRIVSDRHFSRLLGFLKQGTLFFGGQHDATKRFIAPTVLTDVNRNDAVMSEEIFGPILPVLTFDSLKKEMETLQNKERPLALYIFSENPEEQNLFVDRLPFGGGCVNDAVFHLANSNLPFGGTGASGQGAYRGKKSFDTFSHEKSILVNTTLVDLPVRYAPYDTWKLKVLRLLLG